MGITDKITGRAKQAAGDLAGADSINQRAAMRSARARLRTNCDRMRRGPSRNSRRQKRARKRLSATPTR